MEFRKRTWAIMVVIMVYWLETRLSLMIIHQDQHITHIILMQKYFGDKMVFSYSPDSSVASYSTTFNNDGLVLFL